MTESIWDTISRLADWLDQEGNATSNERLLVRIMKLQEEVGEAAQAAMGALGVNPRKGHSHSWDDVDNEVCDVIITGMVALQSLNPNARAKFMERLSYIEQRSLRPALTSPGVSMGASR